MAEETEKKFRDRLRTTVYGAFISMGVTLGQELGLFAALSKFDQPADVETISKAAGCKQRYMLEWLRMMVLSDILETDDKEQLYYLPPHRREVLLKDTRVMWCRYAPRLSAAHETLLQCFKDDGPRGILGSEASVMLKFLDSVYNKEKWQKLPHDVFIAQIPELKDRLEKGIKVVELGCGKGGMLIAFAEQFPASTFIGLDHDQPSLDEATRRSKGKNLSNLQWMIGDAAQLPQEWTGQFGFVTLLNSYHDLPYPTKVAQEMWRILAPGGIASHIDPDQGNTLKEQRSDPENPVWYACSLYHCLSSAMNHEGCEGMGTCAGREKLAAPFKNIGFSIEIQTCDVLGAESHFIYRKPDVASKTKTIVAPAAVLSCPAP